MKDDKFKKLFENEMEKVSGGMSHETENGFLNMKSFDNFNAKGKYEDTTMSPRDGYVIVDDETYFKLKKKRLIESINEQNEINQAIDAKK